jgi:SAM-dependent methyltransferase
MYLYLVELFAKTPPTGILHIGPEFCLTQRLAAIPGARYVTADSMVSLIDLLEVKPAVCMSITDICFAPNQFDLIICSHVLEHVKEDRRAISELFRVLKPGGLALLPVPVDWHRADTDERENLSREERAEYYGEADHVRQYGRDYPKRLSDAGFVVETFRIEEPRLNERYRLDADDPLILARKFTQPVL